ncbi:MAG: site-2 protease family protein [Planctomycetaceae bacterium]
MFGPVQPTAYDLQFSLLGIPVRVLPWFWLTSVLLGFDTLQIGPEYLLAWVGIVFVSILVHEFGHATVAALFGYPPRIFLYHFGGLAMYAPGYNYTQGKSILISLAGPGAGFLVGGAVSLLISPLIGWGVVAPPQQGWTLSSFIVEQLLYVNIWWGVVNLLPVLPLDGGNICRDVCTSMSPRQGERWAVAIGLATAAAVAVWAFRNGQTYIAILFGFMALQNFEQLQRRRHW